MKTYRLICEGRCNPTIAHVDELARQFSTGQPRVLVDMIARQRRLVYTEHVDDGYHRARCVECGAVRKFGS